MPFDVDIALLGAADIFSVLSDDQRRLVAFGARHVHLLPGDQLYSEGTAANGAYVLDTGVLESVAAQGTVATEMRVETRGDVLGETALVTPLDWPTTMIAREACTLLLIERDVFIRLLEAYPELALKLKDKFTDRVSQFVAQVDRVKPLFDQED